jgi:hypothetical protein
MAMDIVMVTDTDMVMKKARKKFNVNEDKMIISSRKNIQQQFFLPTFVFRHSITALVSDFAHGMFAKSECAILFFVLSSTFIA